MNTLSAELLAMIEKNLAEADGVIEGGLTEQTSLLKSGLLDSLTLLSVTSWIDLRVDSRVDLTQIDILEEWDTIERIVDFVESHQKP